MPRKGHSEEQIVFALRQVENGAKVPEVCRKLGLKFHMNPARIPSPCLGLRGVGVLGF